MSAIWVAITYCAAVALAVLLLYEFEPTRWYWHVFSVMLAIGIGLAPVPAEWSKPGFDLLVGFVFVLFLLWGVGAPLFRTFHRRHA